jgi:hypothetical protein
LLDDAVREATIALDRDPLSLVAHIVAMYTNALAGNAAEMERLWKSLEALDPQYPGRLTGHAYALVYIGRVHDALPYWVEYNTATASTEEEKKNAAALQEALATGGDDAYHREFIRQGVEARRERYFSPAKIAMEYASLGETDSVIVWLETALDERDSWLRLLALDPRFDPHRTDPRFRAIVRDLNLEEAEDRFLKLRGRSQP